MTTDEIFIPADEHAFVTKAIADGFTPRFLEQAHKPVQRDRAALHNYTIAQLKYLWDRWDIHTAKQKLRADKRKVQSTEE